MIIIKLWQNYLKTCLNKTVIDSFKNILEINIKIKKNIKYYILIAYVLLQVNLVYFYFINNCNLFLKQYFTETIVRNFMEKVWLRLTHVMICLFAKNFYYDILSHNLSKFYIQYKKSTELLILT